MIAALLARQTTVELVQEAIQRFGPLSDAEIQSLLDETARAVSAALSRLLLGRVEITRACPARVEGTAGRGVALYRATGGRHA